MVGESADQIYLVSAPSLSEWCEKTYSLEELNEKVESSKVLSEMDVQTVEEKPDDNIAATLQEIISQNEKVTIFIGGSFKLACKAKIEVHKAFN